MNWNILKNKKIISKNNEDIVDLTEQKLYIDGEFPTIIDSFFVGDDTEMRPDLLSYLGYGNTDNFDYILKFNSISNPYSIDKNTYILVPNISFYENMILNNKNKEVADEVGKLYDNTKKIEMDPKLKTFISEIKNKYLNINSNPTSPNIAAPGETQAKYNNGKIIL